MHNNYNTTIAKEDEINWQTQSQIHRVLNIAFDGLSKKFIAKTYAYEPPEERVMGWEEGVVVSHMGIKSETLILGNDEMRIASMGLWVSASPTKGWATEILRVSMERLKEKGIKVAIGMTSNQVIINYVVPKFGNKIALVDVPVVGKTYSSKPQAQGMLFNINLDDNEFSEMVNRIKKFGQIKIKGEPF